MKTSGRLRLPEASTFISYLSLASLRPQFIKPVFKKVIRLMVMQNIINNLF